MMLIFLGQTLNVGSGQSTGYSVAENFLYLSTLNVCEKGCAVKKHHLSLTDVAVARQRFHHLGPFQQRQWILDYLHVNTNRITKETLFFLASRPVCQTIWLAALGISRSRFYDVKKSYNAGILFFEKVLSPKSRQGKSNDAIAWMRLYFDQIGDQMPDRLAVHLPSFLTQAAVYSRMKEEFESRGQPVVSSSHFYGLWGSDFSHVSIPKVYIMLQSNMQCSDFHYPGESLHKMRYLHSCEK